ncbi:MAG: DNA repair protein RecN [Deltaproteobacteria bacterium]|nr:DNA repair protein RecN [Deltaproteobacteria bacterium]MBW1826818.1 DNA repair protein RecN [Deltaproteobacteria bacterium]MBW1970480.1 DNA repair protein RecN [Deltaproteobacteria bacterium]MBW2198257.1 DNA repair protein RecN [Deltaproteobacteria bacterium]MBW2228679.1 DNA repair protein RecN [Deltaproteobacteria bacterium]
MLRELSIRNFAIIDDLQISFSEGLAILSGETGAGKSIIINAVNLLLGSRATVKLIRTGYETAELEALFQIKKQSPIAKIMKDNGYNPEEGLLIRRIISRKDRHRIYINGRFTTIGILNLITENLGSISGQHAHQGLLKEDQQLAIIDQFGGLTAVREKVSRCFHEIVPLIRKLNGLKHKRDRQAEHIQLLEFQQKEIRQASVTLGEDTALEQERTRLKNSEALFEAVQGSIEMLYDSQGAAVEDLLAVKKDLERASTIDPLLGPKAERIAEAAFHLEDVADELRTYLKNIQMDESRLDTVEARLDILVKLKRKYGGSLEAVLLRLESIDHELSKMGNLSEDIADTEEKLFELHGKLTELAHKLSRDRKETAKTLAQKVEKELTSLKMPHTKFKISFRTLPADEDAAPYLTIEEQTVFETGIDQATFRIAPNVGEPLKPLPSIVSGGELSRVVLALKAILAETEAVETIVFDEVDAGIGGSVAEVVGKKLSSLARHHQVICITHLPQIAKFGDHHFRISKRVSDGRTSTTIKRLSETERVKEIARMLGGEKITRATLDHAHEMLDNRN